MKYKANGFVKENIDDLKAFGQLNKFMRKFINNGTTVLLILYLIVIAIGSVVLNIKFDEAVIALDVVSVLVAYFISKQGIYFRLIKYFKKLNSYLLEINEEKIEFISNNEITRISRSNIRAIYSLKNTLFIITEDYFKNEKKKKGYLVVAIPKSIFNSNEECNIFLDSLEKDKLKELN
ncbi:hypothetical protein DIC82_16615 [Clostridium beijerinckii]|nr:hypothetical protein DIC82_16615 [Clostridium beijerinckii]